MTPFSARVFDLSSCTQTTDSPLLSLPQEATRIKNRRLNSPSSFLAKTAQPPVGLKKPSTVSLSPLSNPTAKPKERKPTGPPIQILEKTPGTPPTAFTQVAQEKPKQPTQFVQPCTTVSAPASFSSSSGSFSFDDPADKDRKVYVELLTVYEDNLLRKERAVDRLLKALETASQGESKAPETASRENGAAELVRRAEGYRRAVDELYKASKASEQKGGSAKDKAAVTAQMRELAVRCKGVEFNLEETIVALWTELQALKTAAAEPGTDEPGR
uniref:Uncharacterized protein n=1 Tax=Chromera velia CCMP2878 TaxID=1169474 RepID=A0A0G4F993_9ALVE|eukprot:Cvel_2976.t1-p1 / transcript=Cvel_2976.t1 / gene=Cvel_2976 / organism=Chromera_velia_CCMP2878 / gene_product=hypothetical protein / transcript_product=hypothetical protein / location=Cvel_scaffold118:53043-55296(-) / protein_length=271 / sequence_SO=supercontig / SO=protein_coding / is_pseudo=false